MNCIKKLVKEESGAAELIELSIWVPLTIFILFFLIYVGVFILQQMAVASYARKVAILAAREVASPGYHTLITESRYMTGATEADFNLYSDDTGAYKVTLSNKAKDAEVRAYRYWSSNPLGSEDQYYKRVLSGLVRSNSIINAGDGNAVRAEISCKNNILSQTITVHVEQELIHISLLEVMGVKSPTVAATATASVNDVDEIVRNTDFACDSLKTIAEHFHIPVDKVRTKLDQIVKDLGLVN